MRKALSLLPDVGFVNAYGLTETSSTIAVLTPDDHRAALGASDDAVASVGSARSANRCPASRSQIRAEDGTVLGPGETGELFVRGEQVSGRYTDIGSVLDAEGWFPTKDVASLDDDGYLFIGGRSDDTIIRGGENIAPAEIEDVLVEHPHVRDCAVVGADDPEWGQIIVAVVVPARAPTPTPTTCASTSAANCADPAPPTGWCSATNCPPTRPARCCAANSSPTERRTDHRHQGASMIKNGTRLQSQVCDTQVIVVRSADSLDDLRAGGAPMVPIGTEGTPAMPASRSTRSLSDGNLMGKRYVDDAGAEVLVTKAGKGTLSIGSTPLTLKEAKPLPASD